MSPCNRIFLIVLDSVGAGEAPDAERYGDRGAFTLRSLHKTGLLKLDNLVKMGIGNIPMLDFLGETASPLASVARMRERSEGKDTTIGHWELAGHISQTALPTFPHGFPQAFLNEFSRRVGRGILCNRPYSGTKVIEDFGAEHLRTGDLIVYTSADSVLQIAAHEEKIPLKELYLICETARQMLVGELGVGRVIARPFAGSASRFYRTANRRDYSLDPPTYMLNDAVYDTGLDSIAVGKISDIFAERSFTKTIRTHSNEEGMEAVIRLVREDFHGLCFVNLVDFDMLWGHRRDPGGYAKGLSTFDEWLGEFCEQMKREDALIITADHGNDPSFTATTDHTREYVPLLIYGKGMAPQNFGTRSTFADVAATAAKLLGVSFDCDGTPLDIAERKREVNG